MNSAKSKRTLTLMTLVLALGVAVYLNWEYAKNDTGFAVAANQDSLTVNAASSVQVPVQAPVQEALPNKNYGDAQLVSASEQNANDYFTEARLTRTKTRDQALDVLQKSLKNTALSDTDKETLTQKLSLQIASITVESDIENLVKAKGFADCVVFMNNDKVNATVQTAADGLKAEEVAQIRDVILSKVETEAKNITIVEVK